MTDRERLLEILNVPIYPHENVDPLEAVADYLLDNDVVPVVRCKDCKYCTYSWVAPDGKTEHGECYIENDDDTIVGRWGCDFCSYGERITDETD